MILAAQDLTFVRQISIVDVVGNDTRYTIKAVARRTGLSTHVIRVWERRHGAVKPERSESNRRLYSEEEVERLLLLRKATEAGHSIGLIAELPTEEIVKLVAAAPNSRPFGEPQSKVPEADAARFYMETCLEAVERMDAEHLEQGLMRASVGISQRALLEDMIVPLILRIGESWSEGCLRVANEHLASNVIRTFLNNMIRASEVPETAPRMVITTPAGQWHELGALVVAASAALAGWRVIYLGPNLPVEEIASAIQQNRARATCLSIVYPADDARLKEELARLGKLLPQETRLIAGGHAVRSYRDVLEEAGATIIANLKEFREILERLIDAPER